MLPLTTRPVVDTIILVGGSTPIDDSEASSPRAGATSPQRALKNAINRRSRIVENTIGPVSSVCENARSERRERERSDRLNLGQYESSSNVFLVHVANTILAWPQRMLCCESQLEQTVSCRCGNAYRWQTHLRRLRSHSGNRDTIAMTAAQSPDEIFDVVDDNDVVIEQRSRGDVHRLGLRHRAVHILIFNTSGQLMLQMRSAQKDEFPSMWTSSASGHVDSGEDYDEAAKRELQEELGLDCELKRLHKFSACEQTANEFVVLYMSTTDETPTFPAAEIDRLEMIGLDELFEHVDANPEVYAPSFRHLLSWYRTHEL